MIAVCFKCVPEYREMRDSYAVLETKVGNLEKERVSVSNTRNVPHMFYMWDAYVLYVWCFCM